MNLSSTETGAARLPIQEERIYLNHCGIAPLFPGAMQAAQQWDETHMRYGAEVFRRLGDPIAAFHRSAAALLETDSANLSFLRNTAEGLSMIANGLRLQGGDRILSYVHEYPSNHYPWRLIESRGAKLDLLRDVDGGSGLAAGLPRAFAIEDLRRELGAGGVRAVAISHVQFASGFCADLAAIGALCKEYGAWLIVDAAQSLGAIPVRPEAWNIDAVAASGWKWLMGPIGTGLLYTSARLRAELGCTMAGADLMEQGEDYLNHSWRPHSDGKFFEYSTGSMSQAAALNAVLEQLHLPTGVQTAARRNRELRQRLIDNLNPAYFSRVAFDAPESPIQSWRVERAEELARSAAERGVVVTVRGGYLRTAPHFYMNENEMDRAAALLNEAAAAL
ncbi:MAG: aminotransferase class V-fold PLP-dependent enzyme [Leptospirales bacterium]|nr:aminotransferase class V-fold PLP-dependent enzyme [Leptospirales bacterium]